MQAADAIYHQSCNVNIRRESVKEILFKTEITELMNPWEIYKHTCIYKPDVTNLPSAFAM